jgi:shikimate dehydrogenase
MARLGVLGWPVAHSRSPAMHAAAFAALGLTGWRYQRLPVPPALFAETARSLGPAGLLGANVTIPHKEAALAVADEASEAARAIGAANMLTFRADGSLYADNTDAPGLIAALGASPAGASALVLGAGGSARAAVWALLTAGASDVFVLNRTTARAQALAADLGARAVTAPVPADILVNCTSVGLGYSSTPGDILKVIGVNLDDLRGYLHVVDLVYSDGPTRLVELARDLGASVVDGLDVLVAQGALSFERWTGRAAPRDAMRRGAAGAD